MSTINLFAFYFLLIIPLQGFRYVHCFNSKGIQTSKETLYAKYEVISTLLKEPRNTTVIALGELYGNNEKVFFKWNYATDESIPIPEGTGYMTFPPGFVDKTGNYIITDFTKDSLEQREVIFGYYIQTTEPIPPIQWQIHKERKTISGMPVIRATSLFRGRNYTAWFTPQIPVKYGPWKFHGLPGLIVEVYDRQNEFIYRLKEVNYPSTRSIPKIPESKDQVVSWEDFKTIGEKIRQKVYRQNVANNSHNGANTKIEVYEQNRQEVFEGP